MTVAKRHGLAAVSLFRAVTESLLLTALCVCAAVAATPKPASAAASAPAPAPAAKPSAKKPAAADKASDKAPGFAIAPAPAWVQTVATDALPAIPDAPLQVLLMDDQTRLDPAASQRYSHNIRKINASSGLEQGSQIEIVFDPVYQKLSLHTLVVWREGKRLDRLDRKAVKLLQRETQLERQMVDGRMTASIVLEDLRVGDRIEWAYTLTGDNPVFEGKFVDTQWMSSSRGPVALVQRRLLAPAERKILHRVGVEVEASEQQLDGGWHETMVRRRSVPQAHFDAQMPPEDYFADQLEWSEFANWAEIADWAGRLFAPALQDHAALAAKAEEIRAATAAPAERMTLALDFVQQQIRYFGTEVGASSHRPALPEQVLRQRFGDCKDKSAMLANLLGQLGFEAVPAVVSTIYRTQIDRHLPSPLDFDHAVVAVRQGEHWLWLDGTRSLQTGPATVRGSADLSPALLARSGETVLTALPAAQDRLQAEGTDTFHFTSLAEPGLLTSVTTYYGDIAESLRSARASQPADAFEEMLYAELLRAYPKLQREGTPLVEDVPGQNAARVTLKLRVLDYWRLYENRLLVGDVALTLPVIALRVPSMAPRQLATRVALPGNYRQRVRFEFEETMYTHENTVPFSESNGFFNLQGTNRNQAKSTQYDLELQVKAQRVEATQWTAYRDALTKVWPRLSMQIGLPTISVDHADTLKKGSDDLKDAILKGRVKVATAVQADARYRLLITSQQLDSGRLPPKLRAQVLVTRGMAFDHIGQVESARQAFEQAAALDAQSSDAQAALAVNALMRGDDSQVLSAAGRALELAPNDGGPRYTRAQSRYMTGDFGGAAQELSDILNSGGDVDRSYRAVWLYLAKQAQGQDGKAAVADVQASGDTPAWPYPVLRLMRGELGFDAALAQARSDPAQRLNRECELYFFAAEKALLDKNREQARHWLEQSIGTGVVEFVEYGLAQREKARLGS